MKPLEERILGIRAGLGVNRYHQHYTSVKDTVGKHSAGVAFWVILLNEPFKPSSELLIAALAHDIPEIVIGDIPSPAKRAMTDGAREALEVIEEEFLEEHGLYVPLTYVEERQLKLADCFDGLCFCCEEKERGNRELKVVGETYLNYTHSMLSEQGTGREWAIFNILHRRWIS